MQGIYSFLFFEKSERTIVCLCFQVAVEAVAETLVVEAEVMEVRLSYYIVSSVNPTDEARV